MFLYSDNGWYDMYSDNGWYDLYSKNGWYDMYFLKLLMMRENEYQAAP